MYFSDVSELISLHLLCCLHYLVIISRNLIPINFIHCHYNLRIYI